MQFQDSRVNIQTLSAVSKIDQLLRLYQMSKKTDSSKKNIVEKKVNELLNIIKKQPFFDKIEPILKKRIQVALQDPKIVPKVELSSNSASYTVKSSNFVQENKIVSSSSFSGNNSSEEYSKNKIQSKGTMQKISIGQPSSSENKIQIHVAGQFQNSSELSNQKSEDNSYVLLLNNLNNFCNQFAGKVDEILAFNQDIFNILKETQDSTIIYLFGVNNSEKNSLKKLYICTLMKFSFYEICNNIDSKGQNKFQKQCKMFENSLRLPMGLIMIGKGIDDIRIQHIRFLAWMNSQLAVVILLDSYKQRRGCLYEFSHNTLKISRHLNKVQYQQKSNELKNYLTGKQKSLINIEVVKDKLVITKNLTRSITTAVESAQNFIQIETIKECIKEEPNRFPYKLHTKYYVSSKSDYQLFFLDNQLIAFKMNYKEKEYDAFKKYVLQEAHLKGHFIMSASVLKDSSEIKKEFWKLLVQVKTRDQYFLINLSGISHKKTIILSLKQNVTEDQIDNSEPFLFKNLQKSTEVFNVIAIITKQNYRQFEADNKMEVIDLTVKKK